MHTQRIRICNPVGAERTTAAEPAATVWPGRDRISTIDGSTVALRVQWESFDTFMERVEANLRDRFGVADTHWWKLPKLPDWSRASQLAEFEGQLAGIASRSDWAIVGLAA